MDIKAGKPYPSGDLSNFKAREFFFRGVKCSSMEGLLQAFKCKSVEMQRHLCTLIGRKAKSAGKDKPWWKTQTLWWDGQAVKRDSEEYQALLDEAYICLFTQNEGARKALLATNNANLTHSIGKKKINVTVLTEQEFCSRLMNIRAELQETDK